MECKIWRTEHFFNFNPLVNMNFTEQVLVPHGSEADSFVVIADLAVLEEFVVGEPESEFLIQIPACFDLEFARKKKPSGVKNERKKGKLPNQIRHDLNAAIAVGTWKKRNNKKGVTPKTN